MPSLFPRLSINNNPADAKIKEVLSEPELVKKVSHLKTPEVVKGVYMSACVAATPSLRQKVVKLINETEINSVIIDIKDYSGTISFKINKPGFVDNNGGGCQVADMTDFLAELHQQGIYVIGRITSFQDAYMSKLKPDWAVKKKSNKDVVWKDHKGISFIDAGDEEMWKYLVDLGLASYDIGFDELNFDYIRYPSDGDMTDIYFPHSEPTFLANATSTVPLKSIVLKKFFEYLHANFKDTGVITSADLFGMTTTNTDDLNIGQLLENALSNFDYVAPMVYPSHYPVGFLNYKSVVEVNAHPYEIVHYSMAAAVKRAMAIGLNPLKLRPWLQDNDYPVPYTPAMVRAQIQATYDVGLNSWMLWDAGNTYTREALNKE